MQVKYAGKKFEILSTSDVRYQGHMYSADPSELSIAFKNVFCYGTEDRRTGDQKVEMSTCTYEYIVFRAVSLRELWLLEGNGRRTDVTDEILIPLRAGKGASLAQTPNGSKATPNADDAPKRKVGYQSRSSSRQAQQGGNYDKYYQGQPPPGPYNAGYNRRGGNNGGNYQGPPPNAPYDAPGDYPPPPRDYYRNGPNYPPSHYYDQGYYGYGGGGRRPSNYGRQRQAYYDGYRQRERAPQYYNNRGQGYYNNQGYEGQGRDQGYYRNGGYRDPRQYNRDGRYQRDQRGYGRPQGQGGYGQGRRARGQFETGSGGGKGVVGTGAYLDTRRLRGDEIDIKDQTDFDFGAAKDEFAKEKAEMSGLVSAVDSMALEADLNGSKVEKEKAKEEDNKESEEKKDTKEEAEASEEVTKEKEKESEKEHYDASKSFFDGLETETKRSKPRTDMQTQKDVDTSTFGSVAQSYKSRHINRPNQRGQNRGYGRDRQNRGYNNGYQNNGYQRRGYQQGYYQQQQQGQQQRRTSQREREQERSNRWVPK